MPSPTVHRILVLNPGSTSTKTALFENGIPSAQRDVRHEPPAGSLWNEFDARLAAIRSVARAFERRGPLDAVAARGGLFRPIAGGTYRVDEAMLRDARANVQGEHAANLGCALADAVARERGIPAFVVDPICTDEFAPVARISGLPGIARRALAHTLNMHAVARAAAGRLGIPFRRSRFVVAHLGGGISIGPLVGGRIVDVNDASSAGPFSPDRTGTLPLQPFITLCFSGKHTEAEIRRLVMGTGGLVAHLGTNDLRTIERRIAKGDDDARRIVGAMSYQIAKEIAAMASVLRGRVDAIVLTGGLARSARVRRDVVRRVHWIAPVLDYAGEHEMRALALGALRVLRGEERAKSYARAVA